MKQIFINLPVRDLLASVKFYTQLGFVPNTVFSFDDQKCMAWSDQILLMLQNYEMFQTGNGKPIPDPKEHTNCSFTLPVESVEQMNKMVEAALKNGVSEILPKMVEDFMQVRTITDLDGHVWGIIYLDMIKFSAIKSE
jgi:predicted lactoylglutathione lyase